MRRTGFQINERQSPCPQQSAAPVPEGIPQFLDLIFSAGISLTIPYGS